MNNHKHHRKHRPPPPSKLDLLRENARKPVRRLVQFDCWRAEAHSPATPDDDGHVIMRAETYELRNTDFPLRVQIQPGADRDEVLAMLRKVTAWLEREWFGLLRSGFADLPPDEDLPADVWRALGEFGVTSLGTDTVRLDDDMPPF
jgi:hypothetical protein